MKTTEYRYGTYPFDEFNPVQSQVLPLVDEDTHLVVASPTASGKTICAELIAGRYCLQGNGKVVYLSPLKALAEERMRDWSDPSHPWRGLKKMLLTGDYRLTNARREELEEADVVIATYEMMAVRCRNQGEEGAWLGAVTCLLVDEAHFLSSSGRGDHLEHALVLFTDMFPKARVVFLSATMKNATEIARWLASLLKRRSVDGKVSVVESDYRPCKLSIHFVPYVVERGGGWGARYGLEEAAKVQAVMGLVRDNREDQWLVFAHAKGAGRGMLEALSAAKIPAGFHNADLDLEERSAMEERFRSGRIRVLVATSTLAYGLNLPARRVAILGVTRGFSEVDPLDVIQECGRAGRPKYDKEGDAYVVLSQKQLQDWRRYISEGVDVQSVLGKHVGFHLIGEVAEKRVRTEEEAVAWGDRTLAKAQMLLSLEGIRKTLDLYRANGLVRSDSFDETENGSFEATTLGVIASKNYFDPLDVAAWKRNLVTLHERRLERDSIALSWAIASVPSRFDGFIPKNLKDQATEYLGGLHRLNLRVSSDGALALAAALHLHITGEEALVKPHRAVFWHLVQDSERLTGCLVQIDSRVLRTEGASEYWEEVSLRIRYGVGWKEAKLCRLPGIGRVYAGALVGCGIASVEDILKRREIVREVLPEKTFEEIMVYLENEKEDEWAKVSSKCR